MGLLGKTVKGLADVVDGRTFFHNTDAEVSGLLEARPSRTGSGIFGLEKAGANYGANSIPFKVRGKVAGPEVDDNLNSIVKEVTGSNVSDYSSEGLYEHLLGFVPEQEVQAIFKQAGYGARARKSKGVDVIQAFGSDDVIQMDKPSRMARAKEQGFDVDNPVYHGTNADIDAFKINDDGVNLVGRGIYAADAHTAGGYSGGVNPSVYPLNVRGKKATNEDAAIARDAIGKDWDNDLVNDWLSERGFTHRDGRHGIVVFDPKNLRSVNAAFDPAKTGSSNLLASNPAATTGAGILGLGAAAQSNDTYADYSPSNLARLQSDDVGGYQAPQSMAASNIAGLMGSVNKVGYDDPLLGMVASQLPSELMNKIAYNDRRGLLDYAKAYAGLLGF